MTVSELMEQLKQLNPELEVRCWYRHENPIENASQITDAFQITGSKQEKLNVAVLTME